jgi:hypothetical protein
VVQNVRGTLLGGLGRFSALFEGGEKSERAIGDAMMHASIFLLFMFCSRLNAKHFLY